MDIYVFLYVCREKAMAPHSSTLAWKIPWMEEPGRLPSMGSLRVRHDSDFTFTFHFHAEEEGDSNTPVFLPGESQGWGAWWAAIYGVTQSRTRLKRLSSRPLCPSPTPGACSNSHPSSWWCHPAISSSVVPTQGWDQWAAVLVIPVGTGALHQSLC